MANLLIHSMSEFSDTILKALEIAGADRIAEIGAEFGGMSQMLADFTQARDGALYSIDPAPKAEFLDWAADNGHVNHIAKPSLSAFDDLSDIDAWVVDGDHNWFTVYHELKAIDAACARDGKPFLAVMHDVAWPCAFRDMYYAPDAIPDDYRHDYSMDGGVLLDDPGIHPDRGFRGMGQFGIALHEGGPKNGVKCALLDFIDEKEAAEGADFSLGYAEVPAVFGLGILFDMNAPWGNDMAEMLLPLHDNKLIASLERNRLANYLTVLDWQDGFIERAA